MTSSDTWRRFHEFLVRRRFPLLLVSCALTLISLRFAPMVETTGDATEHIPKADPKVREWLEMTNRFGGLNVLMVGLEEPERPLTFDGLSRLARITDTLDAKKSEGVLSARSLTNMPTTHEGEDDTLVAEPLVPAIPRDAEGLRALADRILADTQVPGSLVSRDLMAYVILVRIDPRKDSREVAETIRDIVEAERGPLKAYYFGAPFVSNLITREVYSKLTWVVPLFALGLFGVLFLLLRRFVFALLILIGSGIPLLWWLAAMDALGMTLTLAAVNGALLLLVIGVLAYSRVGELWSHGETSGQIFLLLALVAAAFGGLALWHQGLPAALPYLAKFGEAMFIGLLTIMACGVLTIVPAVSFFRQTEVSSRGHESSSLSDVVVAALAVLGLLASTQVKFAISMQDMFRENDEVGKMLAFFDRRFGGQDFVQVDIKGDLRDPGVVARIARFTDLLEGAGVCSDVRSISQVLAFVSHGVTGLYRIPSDREALANIWFFLEGSEDIRSLVLDDRYEAMVICRVPSRGADIAKVLTTIEDAITDSAADAHQTVVKRVVSLAGRHQVNLSLDAIANILRDVSKSEGFQPAVIQRLREYMESVDAPFQATPDEWSKIENVLVSMGEADRLNALTVTIAGLPSFMELDRPDMAEDIAKTLLRRASDIEIGLRSASLQEKVFGTTEMPVALKARLRGILADLLISTPSDEGRTRFTVAGFPALAPKIEGQLMWGLRASLAIVTGLLVLFSFAVTRPLRRGLKVALDIIASACITLGIGLVVHVDPGSATLYMLAPVGVFLLAPLKQYGADVKSFPYAYALALAVAALSLLLTGMMPVMRVGIVMAVSLTASVLVSTRGQILKRLF